MKKILILFLIITVSLFGQFKEEKNGFTIKTTDYLNKIACVLKAVNKTLIISINSKEEPTYLSFGGYSFSYKNCYLDHFFIDTDLYEPKSLTKSIFKEKDLYNFRTSKDIYLKYLKAIFIKI